MTRAAVRKARARVRRIDTIELPRIAAELQDVGRVRDGDSEREVLLAKLQQLEAERRGLRDDLSQAQICCGSTQVVGVGSVVTFCEVGTNEVLTRTLVSANGNPLGGGTISIGTPVAQALLGRRVGDEVEVPTVDEQKVQRFRITAIREGGS